MSLLLVSDLDGFHGSLQALFAVSLTIGAGEAVAIVGANGAGKSTLLNSIAGALKAPPEAIRFRGAPVGGLPAHEIVRRGVALVPEGRRLFTSLSVEENLRIGGHTRREGRWTLASVYDLFPRLGERRLSNPATLSGGEQQMVAIGRALMSNPDLLLCDELSLGLAPGMVAQVFDALARIREAGTALAIVEQNTVQAARFADRVYCLRQGRVVLEGRGSELSAGRLADAYFGSAG